MKHFRIIEANLIKCFPLIEAVYYDVMEDGDLIFYGEEDLECARVVKGRWIGVIRVELKEVHVEPQAEV